MVFYILHLFFSNMLRRQHYVNILHLFVLESKFIKQKTDAHCPIPSGDDRLLLLLLKGIFSGENASAQRAVRIEAHPIVPKQQKKH